MIIGTVSMEGQTLIFRELEASALVNDLTIGELCDIIAEQISYESIDTDLKISIIDTERKNIFYLTVEDIKISITLELNKD